MKFIHRLLQVIQTITKWFKSLYQMCQDAYYQDGLVKYIIDIGSFITSPFIQAIVYTVIPLYVQNLIWIDNKYNEKNGTFILCIYVAYIFIATARNKIYADKKRNVDLVSFSLEQVSAVLSTMREKMYDRIRDISLNLEDSVFQWMAVFSVQAVYEILVKHYGSPSFRVTIFLNYVKNKENYCKMIAYKNAGSDTPQKYRKDYNLKTNRNDQKPLFVRLFNQEEELVERMDEYGILYLLTQQEVQKEFVADNQTSGRTCQYIGAPIKVSDDTVGFLVQICSYKKNGFGNQNDINLLVTKVLIPIIQVLKVAYEDERLAELYLKEDQDGTE